MLDPSQIRNKAGGGGGAEIRHPASAICPRCGDVNALATPGPAPHRVIVRCPQCGRFEWDLVEHKVIPHPSES